MFYILCIANLMCCIALGAQGGWKPPYLGGCRGVDPPNVFFGWFFMSIFSSFQHTFFTFGGFMAHGVSSHGFLIPFNKLGL
jgi:hypothetical protein